MHSSQSRALVKHVEPLVKSNVQNILTQTTAILQQLTNLGPRNHASIFGLYVCSQDSKSLLNVRDLIISNVLESAGMKQYPVFHVNPLNMSSDLRTALPMKVSEAFAQASRSQQTAILYLDEVDKLWSMISNTVCGLDIHRNLESIRGKSVLLLASGSIPITEFPSGCPFTTVLKTMYQVQLPTAEERQNYLDGIFNVAMTIAPGMSTDEDLDDLENDILQIRDMAVEDTDGYDLGRLMEMYNQLQQTLADVMARETCDAGVFLAAFAQAIGSSMLAGRRK